MAKRASLRGGFDSKNKVKTWKKYLSSYLIKQRAFVTDQTCVPGLKILHILNIPHSTISQTLNKATNSKYPFEFMGKIIKNR